MGNRSIPREIGQEGAVVFPVGRGFTMARASERWDVSEKDGGELAAVKLLDRGGAQRLDRYELVAELASGGMATVYLGRILGVGGFQRFVAIKRLHPHLASEQEFVEMFLDEARLAARIHHPNVVPILEVGDDATAATTS